MSSRTTRLLVIVGVAAAAALAAVLAVKAFDGKKTATKAEYQATIVNARDRVDYAFSRVGKPAAGDEPLAVRLADRLDEASGSIGDAADYVRNTAVAPGFESLNADLAAKLDQFSDSLAATADQFRDPSSAGFGLDSITSLGFTEWDDVNAILVKMQKKGLEVTLLERH